jgi:hypothetical protein
MIAPNEFWLDEHRLSAAYGAEGLTPEQRVTSFIEQFRRMPRIAERETLLDLANVIPLPRSVFDGRGGAERGRGCRRAPAGAAAGCGENGVRREALGGRGTV